ncbi:hypothetical protein [Campylobacter curvus]|nr:hypothetical protein [Campylobacter curvus]
MALLYECLTTNKEATKCYQNRNIRIVALMERVRSAKRSFKDINTKF